MFGTIVSTIVNAVWVLGYLGIFLLMTLESTFFPFPSEVVIIPAGYLAYQGKMNVFLVWVAGTFGSLAGALINYYFAYFLGRPFIEKFGKYFFIRRKSMAKAENFFEEHGSATTFFGRLLIGVRQYISLPAGLAKMNIFKFSLFTFFGAGIWVALLTFFGYFLGENYAAINKNLNYVTGVVVIFILGYIAYLIYDYKKSKMESKVLNKG